MLLDHKSGADQYRLKPDAQGTLFKNFHLHIVFVGYYAATASEEFRDIMNANFWKKHPDVRMKGNPFTSEPAIGDGLYSKSYFMNQYINVRYVGDKKRLDVYDRRNPHAVERYPEFKEELDLLRNQKKASRPLAKLQQRNTHYINKVKSVKVAYDDNSAGTAEAGTALGNFNIETSPSNTPFMSRIITSKKYSYTYTPRANIDLNIPAKSEFDHGISESGNIETSCGLRSSSVSGTVVSGNHQVKPIDHDSSTLGQSLIGTDGLLIDPRKLFDPLDFDDTTDWAELFRVYDKSPGWMKMSRTTKQRVF